MRVDCTGRPERQANLVVAVEKMMHHPPPPVFAKRAQKVLKTKDRRRKKRARAQNFLIIMEIQEIVMNSGLAHGKEAKCLGVLKSERNTVERHKARHLGTIRKVAATITIYFTI